MSQSPRLLSARVKTLGTILLVACAGLVIAGGVSFALQYQRTLDTVDVKLGEKVAALRPVSEAPDVRTYLNTVVEGYLPGTNEGVVALIDGEPLIEPDSPNQFTAITDPALLDAAAAATANGEQALGTVTLDSGNARFIAVPIEMDGDDTQGLYVRAIGLDTELRPVGEAVATFAIAAAVAITMLAFASWFVTGRLLSPLRLLRETANTVTLADLGARAPEGGADEIADLSRTMNSMLDRLEFSVDAQRQLLNDIRHELKTPITIVRGHLEMMDVNDPADVCSIRDLGLSELDRMTRLVDDIDLLSSAQADQFLMKPLDIGMLTERVGELVSAIPGHPFTIAACARGVIIADMDRLTQAWIQLADNAAKYTPAGTPIEIGSEIDDDEARLWVRDHGEGIAPSARRRIFQRFARANANHDTEGSGLGLAIVEAIAHAHTGTCDVTTTTGGGATFTIRIPTGTSPASPTPTPVRAGDVVLQREATT